MRKFRWQTLVLAVALCVGAVGTNVVVTGCNTSQQAVAYKTIYGVEVATTAAYDSYASLVIKGVVSTNDLPKVSKAFNEFQKAAQISVALSRNNSNAVATATLIQQSTAVIDLIASITRK